MGMAAKEDDDAIRIKPEFLRLSDGLPNEVEEKKQGEERKEANGGGRGRERHEQEDRPKKKSKRQRKAERAVPGFCTLYARGKCVHAEKCKFSHDVEQFRASKPEDLPGTCPYVVDGKSCPYGITCRFEGTHPVMTEDWDGKALTGPEDEWNGLGKELQHMLRKNMVRFPMADAVLKEKGIRISYDKGRGNGGAATQDGNASLIKERVEHQHTRTHPREKKLIDFTDKTYLAPLTTLGNLPFRRVCKGLGVDITCCEMAMSVNILQGQTSEWALLRRHPSEDIFGVQVCGGFADSVARSCELVERECRVDFFDVNCGCPIDLVCNKGAGASLLKSAKRLENILRCTSSVVSAPLMVKLRTGYADREDERVAHKLIPLTQDWGASMVTLHGRTRCQRYSRLADWEYIKTCVQQSNGQQVIGNGDCFSYTDYERCIQETGVNTVMVARGALIKPWIFREIKERRHWDISANERMDLLRSYCKYGLEHWGSDSRGVETTRRFLLEWLSFLCRYVPVGLLERVPQKMHLKPQPYFGRNDLETLFASNNPSDWVKISSMLLGPPPENFVFVPKHKSVGWATPDMGMPNTVEQVEG